MGWCEDMHLSAMNKYVRKTYGKKVFTDHFLFRVFQRFEPEDRLAIFAELRDLVKGGMYKHLFPKGKTAVDVIVQDKIKVGLMLQPNGKLTIKTAFIPTKTALAKMTLQ